MNYAAVLFDFDYTLVDSSHGIVTCFTNVLVRNGFPIVSEERIKRTIGKPLEASFSILTGINDPELLMRMRNEYAKEADLFMNQNTVLFPDTLFVLESLRKKNIRTGIVSTKYRYRITSFLYECAPEAYFDIIVGGEDVASHKPDPEGLLFALNQLAVSPENALFVGDSIIDAETAMNAEVDFIGVTSGMTTRHELAIFPHIKIIERLGMICN